MIAQPHRVFLSDQDLFVNLPCIPTMVKNFKYLLFSQQKIYTFNILVDLHKRNGDIVVVVEN
jgi:hypothetical protein